MEVDPARKREEDQRDDLERGHREGDREVAEHEERARNRSSEQFPLGAVLAVDDHAESGEHRVQRDEQADGADGDEGLVRRPGVQRLLQRRRDHEREQHRRHERNEQLARRPRGQLKPPARERCEGG